MGVADKRGEKMKLSAGRASGFLASLLILPMLCASAAAAPASKGDGSHLLRVDHYVRVTSTAPAMAGRDALLYVREVVLPGTVLRGGPRAGRVVLFVHGAGTPAEVAFDVRYGDYSWMAYLAKAGFDVFSMDMTGYGRSTRPAPMRDACNFPKQAQAQFVPTVIAAVCPPTFTGPITTMGSDWNDIDAVVDRIRALRHVDKLSLVGWSQGGPRMAGYAARHPGKIDRIVALAPAYQPDGPLDEPKTIAYKDGSMTSQSSADFTANWDRQVGCPGQYDPAVSKAVWTQMLASDPVGASWGTGVRRAPLVPTWGFDKAAVATMHTPFLMVSGQNDKQVPQPRVRQLYADLGAKDKVFVDLACSSHNAMWEKNHLLLFHASLEWLTKGTVEGKSEGMLRLGYSP